MDGDWVRIHHRLRQLLRVCEDREASPSAAILDSQSVATATMVHPAVGFDANKKIKGRKRHLLVDTLGLMILVVVSAANVPERVRSQFSIGETPSNPGEISPIGQNLGR